LHLQFLLCHEFHRRKFIVPDKPGYKEKDKSKKKKKKGKGEQV
jgi:hypothetical protein